LKYKEGDDMKKTVLLSSLSGIIIVIAILWQTTQASAIGYKAAFSDSMLTVEEMLQYALEDEQLAQQEYLAIMEEFGEKRIFQNIYRAEINHEQMLMDYMKILE
jgi:hypothetical protein